MRHSIINRDILIASDYNAETFQYDEMNGGTKAEFTQLKS